MDFRRPLVMLALAAVVPLVILAAGLGYFSLRARQTVLEQEALGRARLISDLIDREFVAETQMLETMADSPLFDGPLDRNAFLVYANRLLRDQPLWRRIYLTDPEGARLIDAPGTMGAPPPPDIRSHQTAVASHRPTIGSVRAGPEGKMGFAVRVPVLRQGKVLYVLNAVVEPTALRDVLLNQNLPPGWVGTVVDADMHLAARSRGPQSYIGVPVVGMAADVLARGGEGLGEARSLEGGSVKMAYHISPRYRWAAVVGLPMKQWQAPLVRASWLISGAATLCVALAGAFLLLLEHELKLRRAEEAAHAEAQRLEALGRMTGGVAHDFNNLLQIAQGGAEAIKRRADDPDKVRTFADAIMAAAQRGHTLTRQLLAFGRRSTQTPVDFRLADRAPDLLSLLERSGRSDIAVRLELPDDMWPIHADPDALEVALVNLAVNARDAMPEGGSLGVRGRNVRLHHPREEQAGLTGEFVALSVADTGTGILAHDLPRIFEPFFTTKAAGKGTGLGLSQVYGFARQSQGALTVHSEWGRGSTFTLYLPRAMAVAADGAGPPQAPAAAIHPPSGDTGRLLLVEDNGQVAEVTRTLLGGAGYETVWVVDAEAALERIERGEPFDAVLSDIVLNGGMSGLDLAAQLKSARPDLPVVLMTGYSEALARGAAAGVPVLAKPFGQADAVAALRAARAGVAH